MTNQNNGGIIGVWQASLQLTHDPTTGAHIVGKQVQRLGNPLVNELIIGLPDKVKYNRGQPSNDSGITENYVSYPTFPEIISILFVSTVNQVLKLNLTGLAPTNFPRTDLICVFLQGIPGINQLANPQSYEYMRLNTSTAITPPATQSSLGVLGGDLAGYPNGRRPGDDIVDISLDALMGALCHANITCTPADAPVGNVLFTDGAPTSVFDYDLTFPFLKLPLPGSGGSPTPTPSPEIFPYSPIFTPTPIVECPTIDSAVGFSWVLPLTIFMMMAPLVAFIFSSQ